jgi:hypothetical protein
LAADVGFLMSPSCSKIIINKIDLVDSATLGKIKSLVKSLNPSGPLARLARGAKYWLILISPSADLITSVQSKIDLKRVLK